jgi:hypothetical protein
MRVDRKIILQKHLKPEIQKLILQCTFPLPIRFFHIP